jgi:hypothetical protein
VVEELAHSMYARMSKCKNHKITKNFKWGWALVAHTCNPSYTGGREEEDCSSKPAQANSSERTYFKTTLHKKAGRVAEGVSPEFKPQYRKKIKNLGKNGGQV